MADGGGIDRFSPIAVGSPLLTKCGKLIEEDGPVEKAMREDVTTFFYMIGHSAKNVVRRGRALAQTVSES
jgi:hypothetical protein